jgi:hypothetical protein
VKAKRNMAQAADAAAIDFSGVVNQPDSANWMVEPATGIQM